MVQQLFSERIEWEWKIFKQEMMMTSKENVFMLAKTIFQKQQIYLALKKQEFSQEEIGKMLAYEHTIDGLYMELEDFPTEDIYLEIKEILGK